MLPGDPPPALPPPSRFLYVVGRLLPDNRLELLPTFLTDAADDYREPSRSPLVADIFGATGALLLSHRLRVSPYEDASVTATDPLAVRGRIPVPEGSAQIRFSKDDAIIHEVHIPVSEPDVELTSEVSDGLNGEYEVTWRANHPEDAPLTAFLRYSTDDGRTWQPVSLPTAASKMTVNLDYLPGGESCRLMVVVTDSVNTTLATSPRFRVPRKPVQVMILSPHDGVECRLGDLVSFEARTLEMSPHGQEAPTLRWTSSLDGALGTGPLVESTELSPGWHTVTLTAEDADLGLDLKVDVHVVEEVESDPGAASSAS